MTFSGEGNIYRRFLPCVERHCVTFHVAVLMAGRNIVISCCLQYTIASSFFIVGLSYESASLTQMIITGIDIIKLKHNYDFRGITLDIAQ